MTLFSRILQCNCFTLHLRRLRDPICACVQGRSREKGKDADYTEALSSWIPPWAGTKKAEFTNNWQTSCCVGHLCSSVFVCSLKSLWPLVGCIWVEKPQEGHGDVTSRSSGSRVHFTDVLGENVSDVKHGEQTCTRGVRDCMLYQ